MSEERVRSRGYIFYLVVLMGLVALVDQYLSLIETNAIPEIIAHFGIADNYFFYLQGIFGAVAFLVFVISYFADAWGRKIGILILLILMGGAAVLIGLLGTLNLWLFMVLYAIVILATNVNMWTIPVAEESPAHRRGRNGSLAFLIGLIPLYALLGPKIIDSFGWQWSYGFMGIFGLVLILLWIPMKETHRWRTHRDEYKRSIGDFWRSLTTFKAKEWGYVLVTGLIYICWNVAFKMATGTVQIFYLQVLEFDPEKFDTIYTFAGLSTILGALTVGFVLDKIGRIGSFLFSSAGAAISYVFMAVFGLGFLVFVYFFMSMFLGFLLVYISEMFETKIRATAVGFSLTLSRVGYVVGPILTALIVPAAATPEALSAYRLNYLIAAAIALLPLIALLILKYEPKGKTLEEIQLET
ncbi:MAG: MFS transporter [Candidatus Lokiarchaeota archaeon]|nr:MFS transporter [Candidatus Lokiarchaeota archaeon]